MSLSEGTRLGAYEIIGQIGAGGMGEVYRATDTNLGRDVAIKLLPESVAADAERLARFQREAEVLASLNHPNIAQIYGLERSDGKTALVMELVEGPTLADRIAQSPIPAGESLGIAMQIADGLEAAHEQDIVHRDLKPANIKLRPDGTVKVLDFGIAKVLEAPGGTSDAQTPTLTTPAMTQAGILLGTAAYMSPEQARGKAVDERADIWAFGCLLYEMLTGQPAFTGEDVPTTLARVLASDTDMKSIPGTVSPDVRQAIKLCLQKDVGKRLADIRDVKLALKGAFETGPQGTVENKGFVRPLWRWALPASAAFVVGALIAGGVTWRLTLPGPALVSRFPFTPPPTAPLANLAGNDLAISPDGKRLAYVSRDPQTIQVKLTVRDLDRLDSRGVPDTEIIEREAGAMNPFFSSDGQSVGFMSPGRGIMRASLNGEPPLTIIEDSSLGGFGGGSWGPAGTLIYSSGRNLYRISAGGGGTSEELTSAATGTAQRTPMLLPAGRAVLFTLIQGSSERVAVLDLETREQEILIDDGTDALYAPTGHIVFVRGSTLMAAPFDVDQLTVTGEEVALLPGIRHPRADAPADYALSDTGTLVYVPGGTQSATSALVWVNRDGDVIGRAVSDFVDNPRHPRLSPDGGRLAVTTGPRNDNDVWVFNLGGQPPIPLATEDDDQTAVWNPEGTRIAFLSVRDGVSNVYTTPADGGVVGPTPLGTEGNGVPAGAPTAWTANGELILVRSVGGIGNTDIVAISADGSGNVRDIVVTPNDEYDAALSPNSRFLAYTSNRTGESEIWVKGYPDGRPVRISQNGGYEPVWSPDGHELFYLQGNTMMSVSVDTEGEFSFDPAVVELFTNPNLLTAPDAGTSSYDIARDGRFLMIQTSARSEQPGQIVVVQNWFEELKERVPTD